MTTSAAQFERASRHIPGGVNSPVRAFKGLHRPPVFIDHAKGAYLFDVENTRYIDYVGSWGPMITGHADEDVLSAVRERLESGLSFGAPTEREQAEQALRESRERLLQIVEGSTIPTFIIDRDHVITHWNKGCERLLGLPASQMVGL